MNICDADGESCQDTQATSHHSSSKVAIDMRTITEGAITMVTDAAYSMAPVIKLRALKERDSCK